MEGKVTVFDIFLNTMKIPVSFPSLAATTLIVGTLCLGCREEKRAGEAPFLSLKTYSGEILAISPKDNQVTLVVFWATWCRPCLMEIPTLVELQEKYRARGLRVVGVNVDDPEGGKVRPILEHFGVNYSVVISTDETVRKFGGIYGLPTSFIIGRNGLIKDKIEGLAPPEILEGKVLAEL